MNDAEGTSTSLSRVRAHRAHALAAIAAVGSLAAFASVVATPGVLAASVACDPSSLVSALTAVSGSGKSGTVSLTAACTYTMTTVNNSADGNNAFPDILGNVTLIGNGATITRPTSGAPNFRFFIVDDGGSLNLSNLTLSNGSIASGDPHGGAAILNRSQLTVTGVTFLNNRSLAATGGGAIDNHDMGQMTVTTSTFIGNVGLQGGAIEDEATLCHTSRPACGQATVTQSTFTNNTTTQYGGGAFESQLNQQSVPICQGSWPQAQSCQEPGGAHDTLIGDTFSGNMAMTEGGAIASFGTTTVSNSTLYNNGIIGTGPSGDGGGGGVQNTGTISITQTTLSANQSKYGANIHVYNDTQLQPGPPTTTLRMSVVTSGVNGQNCSGSVVITDGGYNLESATSCGFSALNGSLQNTNPQLGPLQSNGGPTQTMALPLQSPAVDAISSSASGCTGSTDQRGVTRPQGTRCDIGAFEVVQSGADTQPPTVPTGLAPTSVTVSSVSLSWNASTDNVGVAGYTVYRNGVLLSTVSGSSLTYNDTSVNASTTYSYTIDAFDAAGNHSAQSQPASATTPAQPDTTAPSTPAGLTAQVGGSGEVDLAWSASTDNVGVTGYTVYRNGATLATVSSSKVSYADKTVASVANYTYTVDAFDAAGNHSAQSAPSTVITPDWTPPSAPTGLSATVMSSSEIDLAWQASTDNVAVAGYTVYRNGIAVGKTGSGTVVYADTGLGHGFTYTYTVTAYDAAGNVSAQSAAASASTPDDIPPATPGGLGATATSPTKVLVSWTASTDNVAVAGYDVFRDGAIVATVGGSSLTYTDTVASGSMHSYTVDAFDAAGNHSGSPAAITVTTPTGDTTSPTTPTGLTATANGSSQVALSWSAATDNVGVAGYTVYRNGVVLNTVGGSSLTYSDGTVAPATSYTYTVDAFDAAGNHSAQSAPASVHVPGLPKFVQGTVVTTGSRVTSVTLALGPVAKGDLLVGWFGQYDSTGQVSVSDSVNGAWTRSASTTWHGGSTTPGDIALYYFANTAAAPNGLTITISATTATYVQASPAEYSGVATVNPLDQVVVAKGSGTSADSGLTPLIAAGELVYGAMVATNGPGTLTPGTSQGVAFVERSQSTSGTQGEEDVAVGAAGQQHAGFTFAKSTPWFMVCAVFKPA